jgi:hypothetical protein
MVLLKATEHYAYPPARCDVERDVKMDRGVLGASGVRRLDFSGTDQLASASIRTRKSIAVKPRNGPPGRGRPVSGSFLRP